MGEANSDSATARFVVGDLVRVPGLKAKHVCESQKRGEGLWSPAEAIVGRLHAETGRIMEMGLPYGKRGARTGVLVEFKYLVPRRLPPEVGDGYYTDETGDRVRDERTAQALVTISMLAPTGEELILRLEMRKTGL